MHETHPDPRPFNRPQASPRSYAGSAGGEVTITGLEIAAALTGTQAADPAQADTRGLDATLERLHVDRQLDGLSPAAPTAAVFGLDDTTI